MDGWWSRKWWKEGGRGWRGKVEGGVGLCDPLRSATVLNDPTHPDADKGEGMGVVVVKIGWFCGGDGDGGVYCTGTTTLTNVLNHK